MAILFAAIADDGELLEFVGEIVARPVPYDLASPLIQRCCESTRSMLHPRLSLTLIVESGMPSSLDQSVASCVFPLNVREMLAELFLL